MVSDSAAASSFATDHPLCGTGQVFNTHYIVVSNTFKNRMIPPYFIMTYNTMIIVKEKYLTVCTPNKSCNRANTQNDF